MSGGFSNPIIGGSGALVYPSIHSPDYVPGVSGWTINKDGTSEFLDVDVRGSFTGSEFIINDAGAFFYSGVPAAGNLIASIASGTGSDPFGNSYQPGINVYGTGGAVATLDTNSGNPALHLLPPSMAHVLVHPEIFAFSTNPGMASEAVWLTFTSGKEGPVAGDDAGLQLISEAADASTPARIVFEFGGTVALTLSKAGVFSGGPAWQTAALANGWTASNGVAGLFYRLTLSGDVEIIADIVHATVTGNSTCFTLPAGFRPSVGQNHPAAWNNPVTSGAASVPWVNVSTAGAVQVTGIEAAGHEIFFHVTVPLGAL